MHLKRAHRCYGKDYRLVQATQHIGSLRKTAAAQLRHITMETVMRTFVTSAEALIGETPLLRLDRLAEEESGTAPYPQ